MNPGGGSCSEPRSHHCTPAWATKRDSVSKEKKKKRQKQQQQNIDATSTLYLSDRKCFLSFPKDWYLCVLAMSTRGKRRKPKIGYKRSCHWRWSRDKRANPVHAQCDWQRSRPIQQVWRKTIQRKYSPLRRTLILLAYFLGLTM